MNTTQGQQPKGVITPPASAAAMAIDWSQGDHVVLPAFAGNITVTHNNMQAGGRYRMIFTQDGGGGRSLTNSPVFTQTTGAGVAAGGGATTVCDIYCTAAGATAALSTGSILFGSAI